MLFAGAEITRKPVEEIVRLGVAHVPEGRGVITELTVEENLRLGGLYRKREAIPPAEMYEMFPPLLRAPRTAGVAAVGRRAPDALDRAGARRPPARAAARRALARARAAGGRPDHGASSARWPATRGLAVLLVEQNARSALSIADRGVVLNLGRVVADRPPTELAADEQLRHAYLGF